MLTFRSYRTNGTTVFFKTGKRTLLLSNGNNSRTLRFQMIQRANSMATRVRLCSFQSSTNASVISPMSDRYIAHENISFCNHSDAVCKMGTVERSNRSIKQNENGMERKHYKVTYCMCFCSVCGGECSQC